MKGSLCQPAETSFLWRDTAMRIRERFNPRAPCGARPNLFVKVHSLRHFNPRAPCGARQSTRKATRAARIFQPTRPLRGATLGRFAVLPRNAVFQPTRPLRGATMAEQWDGDIREISTHAPLAGRDLRVFIVKPKKRNFNPRAPCGARRARGENGRRSL